MDDTLAVGGEDLTGLRRAAQRACEERDWTAADAAFAALHAARGLVAAEAVRWTEVLHDAGTDHHEPAVLRSLAEEFADEEAVVEFVAAELWRRAEALTGGGSDLTIAQLAWVTALMLGPPLVRSEDEALRTIGLVDSLFRSGRRLPQPVASFLEFEEALLRLATTGPRSAVRVAELLATEDPALALELLAGREESAEPVLVAAVASTELDDFARAARLFDHLAARWGMSAREMDVEDRSRWIQAMTDVGRFDEAQAACCGTLRALGAEVPGYDEWPTPGVTPENRPHWVHSYQLLAYRLSAQLGEFQAAWDHLRAAASVDDDGGAALRRSVLRVRLLFSDRTGAAEVLRDLEELAELDPCDTTFAEASILAGSRWVAVAAAGHDPLAGVRHHGQQAARAILARTDCPLSSRRRLWLVLLAGDHERAAAMVDAEPITADEPWSVKVLGAMLAFRRGDDATGTDLLGQVLPERRHDLDMRALGAQASLITGDYTAAMRQARNLLAGVPGHVLARMILAESEFEAALAMSRDDDGASDGVENVQQLMAAVRDYRVAGDLHRDTRAYLATGRAPGGAVVGSEPLPPYLYAEVCRRGMHAAVLAQEGLDRLGLRSDRHLVMDARDLTHHLRSTERACCRRASDSRRRRLLHQVRHLPDRDEPTRLAMLMIAYQKARWMRRLQNTVFLGLGALVVWLALTDALPGPSNDSIRVMVLGVGVLLLLMPFARSLKVGVVELSRDAPTAPLSGRSKSMRTSRVLLRSHHLGSFALPPPPDRGRRARETASLT